MCHPILTSCAYLVEACCAPVAGFVLSDMCGLRRFSLLSRFQVLGGATLRPNTSTYLHNESYNSHMVIIKYTISNALRVKPRKSGANIQHLQSFLTHADTQKRTKQKTQRYCLASDYNKNTDESVGEFLEFMNLPVCMRILYILCMVGKSE
jgi:hypothetical protein